MIRFDIPRPLNEPVFWRCSALKKSRSSRSRTPVAADVQAAAVKYLTPNRVVLSLVPAGKLDLVSKPDRPYENALKLMPTEVKR